MHTPDLTSQEYWRYLDALVDSCSMVIDRPQGSPHPRYPDMIYPLDYGYLEGTTTIDGDGIDVWLGSDTERRLDAILCTVDLDKRDAEIKLLLGCRAEEVQLILDLINNSEMMRAMLIRREALS